MSPESVRISLGGALRSLTTAQFDDIRHWNCDLETEYECLWEKTTNKLTKSGDTVSQWWHTDCFTSHFDNRTTENSWSRIIDEKSTLMYEKYSHILPDRILQVLWPTGYRLYQIIQRYCEIESTTYPTLRIVRRSRQAFFWFTFFITHEMSYIRVIQITVGQHFRQHSPLVNEQIQDWTLSNRWREILYLSVSTVLTNQRVFSTYVHSRGSAHHTAFSWQLKMWEHLHLVYSNMCALSIEEHCTKYCTDGTVDRNNEERVRSPRWMP